MVKVKQPFQEHKSKDKLGWLVLLRRNARMFKQQADVLHINEHEGVSEELLSAAQKHEEKIEEARKEFPKVYDVEIPPAK